MLFWSHGGCFTFKCQLVAFGEPHQDSKWKKGVEHSMSNIQDTMCKMNINSINIIIVSDLHCSLSITAPCSSMIATLHAWLQPQCYWQCQCDALCLKSIYHYSTSPTSHMAFPLDPQRADQNKQKHKKKPLTFCWALQFPPPSFLARRRQAVFLVFLRVLLFLTGQESVLLG